MTPTHPQSAVLVSHGQPSEPAPPEADLAALAAQVGALLPGWSVHSATLAGDGTLQRAMEQARSNPDGTSGGAPFVYPLFMTHGWFTRSALPDRIADPEAHILPPLGIDPALPELARACLAAHLEAQGWTADETCLIIASHGSGRSANSSRDTRAFADALAGLTGFGDIRLGYIEEPPYLGDVVFDTGPRAICLPFFAAKGGHVIDDIPDALDLAAFTGLRLDPIGTHPAIPQLIAQALLRGFEARKAA